MPEQETAGRQPEWALMYAPHDALRRDLGAAAHPPQNDGKQAVGSGAGAVRRLDVAEVGHPQPHSRQGARGAQPWHTRTSRSILNSVIICDHVEARVSAESILCSIIRILARLTRSLGSRLGSQRQQIQGYARPLSATISAATEHVRPHLASSGDRPQMPSKQRDAGSNPARRTNRPGQSYVPILKDRAGSPTGSHRTSFPLLRPSLPPGERKPARSAANDTTAR